MMGLLAAGDAATELVGGTGHYNYWLIIVLMMTGLYVVLSRSNMVKTIIGLNLFQLPSGDLDAQTTERLTELATLAPNAPTNSPDPYGSLGETMFTLFRILTGEDWTDLRYNLITASELNLIHTSPWVITLYHSLWFVISAFLLLNLLVGAILNNYQVIMDESKKKAEQA